MPYIDPDGVTLWYDTVPSPRADAAPAVLIQGLGMQATDWPAAFLSALASERPLILFDNRDAGMSQLFGPPHDLQLQEGDFPGWGEPTSAAPYSLCDMATDAIQLLDAFEIPAAHLIGFSMGGMIAQILGAQYPDRILSVTGLMTSAGQAWLESSADADRMMRRSIVAAPEQAYLIDLVLAAEEVYAGPSELAARAERSAAIRQALARGHFSAGIWRQSMAMRATGDRQDLLRKITAPLLMLHGREDPVIALAQATAILELLPAARFVELSRTGHVLTEDNSLTIAGIISAFWNSLARS